MDDPVTESTETAAASDVTPRRGLLSRLAGRSLPGTVPDLLGAVLMLLLVLNAVAALVLAVLFLPLYLGRVPFPIAALLAGLVNIALVDAATLVSRRLPVVFLPLGAWLLAFLVAAGRGPGGDVVLRGDLGTLLLFVFGGLVPLFYLFAVVNQPPPKAQTDQLKAQADQPKARTDQPKA